MTRAGALTTGADAGRAGTTIEAATDPAATGTTDTAAAGRSAPGRVDATGTSAAPLRTGAADTGARRCGTSDTTARAAG